MKIAVLLGGTSAERDVSMVSGISVARALVENGHQVEAIDCAYGDRIIQNLDEDISKIIAPIPSDIENKKTELDRNILTTVNYLIQSKFELVFIALHGGYGENGQLQALLEVCHIPYTGSNSFASALGMNKHYCKILFQINGVPTAPWNLLKKASKTKLEVFRKIGFPAVVKPNDQGSTVGLTIIHSEKGADEAIKKAFEFSESVMLEKYISGKELTVSILGQQPLPVIEIIPVSGFYDYESKYQSGKTQYVCPAEISKEMTTKLQEYGLQAYNAIGCSGYARVDFRMNGGGEVFCLEVNTLPGMTSTSLVPKAAKEIGIDFNELIEKIIKTTLK
jgi:D-alanine-D-alanine ligase